MFHFFQDNQLVACLLNFPLFSLNKLLTWEEGKIKKRMMAVPIYYVSMF